MNAPSQKRTFRSLAAATLLVWLFAQIACFLHCHYPGNPIPDAHAAMSVLPEMKCCASKDSSNNTGNTAGANAACLIFKTVTLSGHSPVLTPPDSSFTAFIVLLEGELIPTTPTGLLQLVSIPESSPPPLSLLKPALLSLPPPCCA
ncbi:MAG: hypothetical protein H0X66_22385 [Verrucomicrobia bacterium]|nr:hypothetical protein [Verrucomicrobiota bacterium]